jgi:quinolinate synthase
MTTANSTNSATTTPVAQSPGPVVHEERRAMPRVEVTLPGKLLGQGRAKFVSVRTIDVSTTGALIEWDADQSDPVIHEGEGVGLGLDATARSLIPFDTIVSGRVVRVDGHRAAVMFDERHPGAPLPAGRGRPARRPAGRLAQAQPARRGRRGREARRVRRLLRRALHGRDRRHAHPEPVEVILPDLSPGARWRTWRPTRTPSSAWDEIHEALNEQHDGGLERAVVPITYVNSSAAIKAFVGAHEGACCTSSNADAVFEWAMNGGVRPKADGEEIKILFLPDQHLGRNTAHKFGVDVAGERASTTPRRPPAARARRLDPRADRVEPKVILWAGHCSVHKLFRPEHCDEIRDANGSLGAGEQPTTILVHPECSKEVVDRSDLAGSTEFIIQTIEAAEPGTKWAVGHRVPPGQPHGEAVRRAGRRGADPVGLPVPVHDDVPHRQPHLLWVLDGLCGVKTTGGETEPEDAKTQVRNVIRVHPEVRGPALLAINRMLELSSSIRSRFVIVFPAGLFPVG